ncbi:MAG: GlsB/YeaQ/YmgE family stress response membrane protein [Chloroflexi bacterium]|jgi:uncharacterized membrane protein YeaQ/YmgE (transglycosylase-associated protein family)|nr:GlsB/YeaQ/YmgE family stress response membrane protein [Chloroflexota bacterium]
MNILVLLLVGLIAGFLADKLVKNTFGTVGDMLIGVVGSFVGSWIFGKLGLPVSGLLWEIIAATAGAVVLLLIINLFKKK